MKNKNLVKLLVVGVMLSGLINTAEASLTGIKITEWMYNADDTGGEFVEFTNFGATAVDFTGWSFDDNSRAPGSKKLSGFGLVAAGESVILTELSAVLFRTEWNLASSVKVIGGNTQNLARSDEINLYNNSNALVDRLTYNDQGAGKLKGPRTKGTSGVPNSLAVLGTNNASLWHLSVVGNTDGAYTSMSGDIGSPGKTSLITAVPLPATAWMFGAGLLGLARKRVWH